MKDGEEQEIPLDHVHDVTVLGAAIGWVDTVERFGGGKLSLEEILAERENLSRGFQFLLSLLSNIAPSYIRLGNTGLFSGL